MARWDPKRGTWRIVVDATPPGGKRSRLQRDLHEPNNRAGRKAAELAEAALRLEAARRLDTAWPGSAGRDRAAFAAEAAEWVERNRGRWSPKTLKETKYALRRYILPHIGDIPLGKLTPRHIEAMYGHWTAAGRSPSTMRRWHGMVRAIFADAERLGDLVGANPMVRVRPAGGKAPERRIPSPDEIRRVVDAAPNPLTGACFELAVASGARRGSVTALRWRDIDLEAGTVSFVQAVAEGCDGAVLKANKANKAYPVTVAGSALEALRAQRRRAIETALALGVAGRVDDLFVFSNDGGLTHWNVSWPSHAWRVACARAGVRGCRLHDARHFSASQLLAAGRPTRVVADRLGCTEGNVIRTYSHRVPGPDDAMAAEIMARLLAR